MSKQIPVAGVVEVGPEHPAWAAYLDDDWNGATFSMWIMAIRPGSTFYLRPPSGCAIKVIDGIRRAIENAGASVVEGVGLTAELAQAKSERDAYKQRGDELATQLQVLRYDIELLKAERELAMLAIARAHRLLTSPDAVDGDGNHDPSEVGRAIRSLEETVKNVRPSDTSRSLKQALAAIERARVGERDA